MVTLVTRSASTPAAARDHLIATRRTAAGSGTAAGARVARTRARYSKSCSSWLRATTVTGEGADKHRRRPPPADIRVLGAVTEVPREIIVLCDFCRIDKEVQLGRRWTDHNHARMTVYM